MWNVPLRSYVFQIILFDRKNLSCCTVPPMQNHLSLNANHLFDQLKLNFLDSTVISTFPADKNKRAANRNKIQRHRCNKTSGGSVNVLRRPQNGCIPELNIR